MPITKRGSLALAGGTHVLQNVATKYLLKQPSVHKGLLASAMQRETSVGQNILRGLVPEVGILQDEALHASKRITDYMARKGINMTELSRRQLVALRTALGGNFNKAIKQDKNIANSVLGGLLGNDIPTSAITDLEKVYSANQVFGPLGKGVASQITAKNIKALRATPEAGTSTAGRLGEAASIAGIAAADPVTGAVNVGKRLLTNKHLGEKLYPVRKAQEWSNRVFLLDPSRKSHQLGLAGKELYPGILGKAKKYFKDYGLNYTLSGVEDLSHKVGLLKNKYSG